MYEKVIKKTINFIYNRLFCCNHTCYCVSMVSVTPALRYVMSVSRYQSRSSMYIRGLIPWNSTEFTEAVQIANKIVVCLRLSIGKACSQFFQAVHKELVMR